MATRLVYLGFPKLAFSTAIRFGIKNLKNLFLALTERCLKMPGGGKNSWNFGPAQEKDAPILPPVPVVPNVQVPPGLLVSLIFRFPSILHSRFCNAWQVVEAFLSRFDTKECNFNNR